MDQDATVPTPAAAAPRRADDDLAPDSHYHQDVTVKGPSVLLSNDDLVAPDTAGMRDSDVPPPPSAASRRDGAGGPKHNGKGRGERYRPCYYTAPSPPLDPLHPPGPNMFVASAADALLEMGASVGATRLQRHRQMEAAQPPPWGPGTPHVSTTPTPNPAPALPLRPTCRQRARRCRAAGGCGAAAGGRRCRVVGCQRHPHLQAPAAAAGGRIKWVPLPGAAAWAVVHHSAALDGALAAGAGALRPAPLRLAGATCPCRSARDYGRCRHVGPPCCALLCRATGQLEQAQAQLHAKEVQLQEVEQQLASTCAQVSGHCRRGDEGGAPGPGGTECCRCPGRLRLVAACPLGPGGTPNHPSTIASAAWSWDRSSAGGQVLRARGGARWCRHRCTTLGCRAVATVTV